jgi:uncharacterized protein
MIGQGSPGEIAGQPAIGCGAARRGLPRPTTSLTVGRSYDQPVRLSLEEGRIIGCLIEKELTTPQQYPLTLNALVSACNQSSNRDPVVCYDDRTVKQAVASLKDVGVVHFVHPSHGRSVIRFRHALDVRLGLDERRLALVAVLLLRGPQTAGELRARTERMATFDGIAAVDADLEHMSGGPEPVVVKLPRRPGQKEERWAELLTPNGPDISSRVGRSCPLRACSEISNRTATRAEGPPLTVDGIFRPAHSLQARLVQSLTDSASRSARPVYGRTTTSD